ncbi:L domain-like protein [Cutaneotrichosporon oleaginosum]|uniref:L domain-like protein n=1 Tax=Cutaneotrichosporon oleaginosum TaxID=879819 RepID=A0A0J1AUJ3_9TREE|nr:L domain-like protein [Cutaneotrichosporon oleaginosum]KLT38944.1 L domain-like protein [Cutaneotrichosporon oleaginosum]TXT07593.1 hypothetical protein COLE_04517 [Cutaneotrichosporon oleaginosum]
MTPKRNLNPFTRPPLITVPAVDGAAHDVDVLSPPAIHSQHASVIFSAPGIPQPSRAPGLPTDPFTPDTPTRPTSAGSLSASDPSAPLPADFPAPPTHAPRGTHKPLAFVDVETLRDSQYSSEGSDRSPSPRVYEPSAEEVAQFAVLTRASLVSGSVADRRSVASDEEKHTVLDKGKGRACDNDDDEHDHHRHAHAFYPINIDEWAHSPPLSPGYAADRPSPPRDGFTITPGFGAHCTDPSLTVSLARSDSSKSAGLPRATSRRAPPPPLKLERSNSSLALEKLAPRNSQDSMCVEIEKHRPAHVGPEWDDSASASETPPLFNVSLTPFASKEASHSTSNSGKRKSGLVGILKTKRASMREQKRVRVASPKMAAWSSSLHSPQARQRSPGKTEYNIGMYQPPKARRGWRARIRPSWVVGAVLLIIIIVAIVVPFKVKRSPDAADAPGAPSNVPPNGSISDQAQPDECLRPFMDPGYGLGILYTCDACVASLADRPNDFLSDGAPTGVGAMRQYCALMDVLFTSSVQRLHTGKWGADMAPCDGWQGVQCDRRGRITAVELVYPGVPAEVPPSFTDLVALRTLRIVGDGKRPSSLLPPGITSLPNLTTLDFQYTNLGGAVANLSSTMRNLTLVSNPALRAPSDFSTIPLESLVLADQNVTALPALPSSLKFLDLSHNALKGNLNPLLALPYLRSLYLQHNDLERFIPPPRAPLQALNLAGNPRLVGGLWKGTCEGLRACDARGTAMNRNCTRCYYEE